MMIISNYLCIIKYYIPKLPAPQRNPPRLTLNVDLSSFLWPLPVAVSWQSDHAFARGIRAAGGGVWPR